MKHAPISLRSRALAWLAQRDHSRSELRRKLLRQARRQLQPDPAEGADDEATAGAVEAPDPAGQIDALLDWLEARGYLDEQRFTESRVRVREAGMGTRRIQMELAQHGLKLDAQPLQALRDSELQRAQQLWQRKFGNTPLDARDRARQMRFLSGRGFAGEVIRRVLAAAGGAEAEDLV